VTQDTHPTQFCEALIREDRQYNIDNQLLPRDVAAAERLLARQAELAPAYAELYRVLRGNRNALMVCFRLLFDVHGEWNPQKAKQARQDRDELGGVNRQIASQAEKLAELLRRRSELHNQSGFSDETVTHIVEVIDRAGAGNGHYRSFLREPLTSLHRFDGKYWPNLADCLDVIGQDADGAEPEATDPLTAAATDSSHPSKSDFFRALLVAIEEYKEGCSAQLPRDFKPSDETLATLGNCILGLDADEGVDGAYVKQLRQRVRAKKESRATS